MPLEVTGLKRSYDDFSVALDFRVEMGETLALVGPSGSGKTTALNLLAGLAEQDEGKIIIGGEDISALPSWKRNISVVFQDLALFPHLDAGKNIAYGLMIRGVKRKERARIVNETLEIVRLPGYASRRVDTLSGGERQRIALARALASSPRALLLDEPFSSLDAPLRKELRREFLGIRAHSEAPCIFVTHDREEAMMLGDRVALMRDGRIVESGPGRELLLSPKTEFTARFFGAGQVLPCEITGKTGSAAEVSSPLGSLTVPPLPEYDSAPYRLFIPHDAFCFEEPANRAEYRPLDAVADEVIPEGLGTLVKLRPAAREYSGPNPAPVELIIGPRVKPPSAGSAIKLWVNQNLLKFVRAG